MTTSPATLAPAAPLDPMRCNLAELLLAQAARRPEAPAIVTDAATLSYGDVAALVARLAGGLAARGLAPGDRVISIAKKSPEAIALFFATVLSGAIYVPVNPALTDREIGVIAEEAQARLVVLDDPDARPGLGDAARVALSDLAEAAEAVLATPQARGEDPAVMLFTSGTTGRPKGSVQTHRNLAVNLASLGPNWGMSPGDVLLHILPIYHGHGLFLAAGGALVNGATLRLLDKFDLDRILGLLPEATVLMAVPTIHARLVDSPAFTAEVCRNLRLVTSGSAPLPVELRDRFLERTGIVLLERYGSTEAGMIASNPLDGERRRGSVGRAYDGVELKILGPDGAPVPDGEVGQLYVRSPYVNAGYWQADGTIRPNVDAEGYFDTEDLVVRDAQGYLSIVGRAKDLIISGGLNIYPREVENALEAVDGIAEAAVVGVPHPDYGEAVLAVAVAGPGGVPEAETVQAALAESLTGYKRPKRIEFVDALPRNEMGKVLKRDLAERFRTVFTG